MLMDEGVKAVPSACQPGCCPIVPVLPAQQRWQVTQTKAPRKTPALRGSGRACQLSVGFSPQCRWKLAHQLVSDLIHPSRFTCGSFLGIYCLGKCLQA